MRKEKLEELKRYVEELKTIERIERFDNNKPFLKVKSYNYKLNNGIVLPREQIIKGKGDGSAAIVMPITKDNEVLTVVEPRTPTKLGVAVGFPAGYIEPGENPIISASRELREETGFTTDKELIKLDSFYQDEGCSSAYNYSFLALDCEKTNEQELDKDEIVRYMLFSYEEFFELEEMGYICSSNVKLTLEKSKKYMKGRL